MNITVSVIVIAKIVDQGCIAIIVTGICTKGIKGTIITDIIIVNFDNICDNNTFINGKIVWLVIEYATSVSWSMNSIIVIDIILLFILALSYGTSTNLCLINLFVTKCIGGDIVEYNSEHH